MAIKYFKKILFVSIIIAIVIILGNYLTIRVNNSKLLTTDISNTIPNDNFVDQNFYNCVIDNYNDINGATLDYNYNLEEERINTITSLTCNNKGITNLKGLEKLTKLTYISLSNNNISSINLSHNPRLIELYVHNNNLNNIDLANNPQLETLNINNNNITELNLINNPKIIELYLKNNQINDIDLPSSTKLVRLSLENNDLSDIDLTHNTLLSYVNLNNNKLETIDLSNNTSVKSLYLDSNKLTNIDLSHNNILTDLSIDDNDFESNQYIYVLKNYNLDNVVILPQSLSWSDPTYTSSDDTTLEINSGKVKALKEGSAYISAILQDHYTIKYNYVGVKLTSPVYKINDTKNQISIGIDKASNINDNLLINSNITKDINQTNTKLSLKYKNKSIKEFNIIGLLSDKYKAINNKIELDDKEDISYDSFISNIKELGVNYKIFDNNTEIKAGKIKSGMDLKVYLDNDIIDSYKILYKKDNVVTDELVQSDNTNHNKSLIVIIVGSVLLIIGVVIISIILKNNKNKEDNV